MKSPLIREYLCAICKEPNVSTHINVRLCRKSECRKKDASNYNRAYKLTHPNIRSKYKSIRITNCKQCNKEFAIGNRTKFCKTECSNKWIKKNPASISERAKLYQEWRRSTRGERLKELKKDPEAYREHLARRLVYDRKYREANRKKIRQYHKKYYHNPVHKEKRREYYINKKAQMSILKDK